MYGYLRTLLWMVTTRISHWTLRAVAFILIGYVGLYYRGGCIRISWFKMILWIVFQMVCWQVICCTALSPVSCVALIFSAAETIEGKCLNWFSVSWMSEMCEPVLLENIISISGKSHRNDFALDLVITSSITNNILTSAFILITTKSIN